VKLVTHCSYVEGKIADHKSANDKLILEYGVYKMLEALKLPSYRARLAKIDYQDKRGRSIVEGFGFFLEPSASMEQRCGLQEVGEANRYDLFDKADKRIYASSMITRILADARDYYLNSGHNSDVMLDEDGVPRLAVPYDFNDSGVVQGRGMAFGFEKYPEDVWPFQPDVYRCLRTGPFGQECENLARNVPGWDEELLKQLTRVLEHREDGRAAIEALPIDADQKAKLRNHLDKQLVKMEALVKELALEFIAR
jgi:hypothetical protein